ncbi:hypothetical protein TCAL_12446 [Tigriopus californicus]|uniref:Uncharacterized protein n=1 Tax=Tigriopus californicus TaxID=6832 RepID=A0A553PKC4_TIGCA|nr:hypothetical protein TCAL_12446 [Tigriopus californicus]|eukprot:TCALIF_12446-PA protein Name:"Protein of unknown function" AED:0.27 eAED:0.27 QI:111/0.5/0.66/0.66/0.5/0.66/3/0/139
MQMQAIFLALAIAMVSAQNDTKIKQGQACSETSQCRPNLVCNNWRNGSKLCQPAQCSVNEIGYTTVDDQKNPVDTAYHSAEKGTWDITMEMFLTYFDIFEVKDFFPNYMNDEDRDRQYDVFHYSGDWQENVTKPAENRE